METIIDRKLKELPRAFNSGGLKKPILEHKAIESLKPIEDAKGYRMWNRKFKNALEQVRENTRRLINWIQSLKEQEVLDGMVDERK